MPDTHLTQDQVAWATCNVLTAGRHEQFTRGDLLPPAETDDEFAERTALRLGGAIRTVAVVYAEGEQVPVPAPADGEPVPSPFTPPEPPARPARPPARQQHPPARTPPAKPAAAPPASTPAGGTPAASSPPARPPGKAS